MPGSHRRHLTRPIRGIGTALPIAGLLVLPACASSPSPAASGPTASTAAGSSSAASSPSTTGAGSGVTPSEGPPVLRAYEFPGGMIEGALGGGKLYTRVEAVVAVPAGTGRHPVAVIVHGSYPSCVNLAKDKLFTSDVLSVRWPEGCPTQTFDQGEGLTSGPDYVRSTASFAYLARELAQRGFVVVTPDVNTKERFDWGGEPDPQTLQTNLVKLHLDLLRRIDAGDGLGLAWSGELRGRMDTRTVAVIGHSSGGGYALQAGYGDIPGTKAVAAIEPAFKSVPKARIAGPPTFILMGECDEQIPIADSRREVADLVRANPSTAVVSATMAHATHIGMLTGGGSHTIGLVTPSSSPACAAKALLNRTLQRAATARITGDFLVQAFAGTATYALTTVEGATVTAAAKGPASVTVAVAPSAPEGVDPKSLTFTSSETRVLPAKPAGLKLNGGPGHL
ncbi:MAG: dienelactone hydrolase family protein [Austwickia sp.]|nr:dienelactone hydrolase family protein [Austwickia sp.]